MSDPFDLDRFLRAQDAVLPQVERELGEGQKRSHWMWFIFPQLRGLGRSETARRYGIAGAEEARAYLAHPVLGARLRHWVALVLAVPGRSAKEIFGSPDDVKFRSCLTLFAALAPGEALFRDALARFYGAAPDAATLALLRDAEE
ncbi:DUF1810 domain-containing protein [Pseudoroseomonas cervicalis]|uniref:DUF1810 domain-containing protein n=1 Tax=Teichococcus cervicalis TaxID=204525 RepID=UPI00277F861F|nr:uncharacterized protein (DUF1810 family) [Pseudoroseomonas cervicalis]